MTPATAQSPRLKRKKRKPRARKPEWAAVKDVADRHAPKVAAAVVGSLELLRQGVNHEALRVALERNDAGAAIEAFPWDLWSAALSRMLTPRLAATMAEAGEAVGREMVVQIRKYDPNQPRDPAGSDTGGQWTGRLGAAIGRVLAAEPKRLTHGLTGGKDRNSFLIGPNGEWVTDEGTWEQYRAGWALVHSHVPDAGSTAKIQEPMNAYDVHAYLTDFRKGGMRTFVVITSDSTYDEFTIPENIKPSDVGRISAKRLEAALHGTYKDKAEWYERGGGKAELAAHPEWVYSAVGFKRGRLRAFAAENGFRYRSDLPIIRPGRDVTKADFSIRGLFDMLNPRAARYAALQAARLVTRVTDATKWALRQVLADATARGVGLRAQADSLKRILVESAGLDARRARQLQKFQARLEATGAGTDSVGRRVAQQRDRLLMDRARTIARHETQDSAVAGQVELWQQATEAGLIPSVQLMEWITTPGERTCPICAPMDGQKVPQGQLFVSPYDDSTHARPPAHVQCRCALALVIDDPVFDLAKFDPSQPRDPEGSATSGQWTGGYVNPDGNAGDAQLVEDYTRSGGTYREINEGLRAGKAAPDLKNAATVNVLDKMIDGGGGLDGSVLHRGMAGWEPGELGLEEGYEFTDPAFVSTARDKAVAQKFAMGGEQEMSGERTGILFTIKGARRGANLDSFARYGETETLLARGTRFRVVKVTEGYPGEELATVTLEVIG